MALEDTQNSGGPTVQSQPLEVTCPLCGFQEKIIWDGLYRPRYHTCSECKERYIYEPMKDRVKCSRIGDTDCCGDPDCLEVEMSSGCEE